MTAALTTHTGVVASSPAVPEGPAAMVPRSSGALAHPERSTVARRCAWPPCSLLFVPRTTGGKPQKYDEPRCRELAKAAARATCPHCGGSLRPRGAVTAPRSSALCACGCGQSLVHRRRFATDACRKRSWERSGRRKRGRCR